MPVLRRRSGSQLVEATMVLPLTVLIMAALIGIFMTFYVNLTEQISTHAEERETLYASSEVRGLRLKDAFRQAAEHAAEETALS